MINVDQVDSLNNEDLKKLVLVMNEEILKLQKIFEIAVENPNLFVLETK